MAPMIIETSILIDDTCTLFELSDELTLLFCSSLVIFLCVYIMQMHLPLF